MVTWNDGYLVEDDRARYVWHRDPTIRVPSLETREDEIFISAAASENAPPPFCIAQAHLLVESESESESERTQHSTGPPSR